VVEASFLACVVYEGQNTRLLVFCGRASRVGWSTKGVESSAWRDCSPEARLAHEYVGE
jgi:hypothetical protein